MRTLDREQYGIMERSGFFMDSLGIAGSVVGPVSVLGRGVTLASDTFVTKVLFRGQGGI